MGRIRSGGWLLLGSMLGSLIFEAYNHLSRDEPRSCLPGARRNLGRHLPDDRDGLRHYGGFGVRGGSSDYQHTSAGNVDSRDRRPLRQMRIRYIHGMHKEDLGARCARPQPPRYGAVAALIALTLCLSAPLCTAGEPHNLPIQHGDLVRCQNGVVVSVHPLASRIGADALVQGGTSVDAAVATAFALAVTWPGAGNIGGGRLHGDCADLGKSRAGRAGRGRLSRSRAGRRHQRDVCREARRTNATSSRRRARARSAAWRSRTVASADSPGASWCCPPSRLARRRLRARRGNGGVVERISSAKSEKQKFAELHRVFGKPGGGAWKPGDRLVQPELADTLEQIAERGADAFYLGRTADQIAAEMRRGGGLITKDDLANYRAKFREPVRGTYRGFEIVSVPPSSSGGTTLIEELNILENFDLARSGPLVG